jgi:hypothetical protein
MNSAGLLIVRSLHREQRWERALAVAHCHGQALCQITGYGHCKNVADRRDHGLPKIAAHVAGLLADLAPEGFDESHRGRKPRIMARL